MVLKRGIQCEKNFLILLLCLPIIGGIVFSYSRTYKISDDKKQLEYNIKQFINRPTVIYNNIDSKQELNTSYNAREVVEKNLLYNHIKRLPENDKTLDIIVLRVKNDDKAVRLYENQASEHIEFMDKMKKTIINFKPYPFKSIPTIIVGAERKSGYILVEGSQELSEEITMIQGLDSGELKNYYLVAKYIDTLKKYSKLGDVIK